MIDLVKSITRYFSSQEASGHNQTEHMMSGGLGPWKENNQPETLHETLRSRRTRDNKAQRRSGLGARIEIHEQTAQGVQRKPGTLAQSLSGMNSEDSPQYGSLAEQDKLRMPPPTRAVTQSTRRFERQSLVAGSQFTSEEEARSMVSKSSLGHSLDGISESEFQKRAQKHAAAFAIHPASGFWYQSERGLYYHLWMRGYERLLPLAWAPDFKTYPLLLFHWDDREAPLITSHHSTQQFHALRALRELAELGHKVRDQMQAKFKSSKIQRTIQREVETYVEWALSDANFYPTQDTVPAHHIACRQRGETVGEAISSLANAMHDLVTKHRSSFPADVPDAPPLTPLQVKRESLSTSPAPPPSPNRFSNEETQIQDDSQGYFPPVIIGFLIVGSTVTIFTLNAHNADMALEHKDETCGIHMLGRFSFSEDRYDVWNALAIAIAACHIRTALLAAAKPSIAGPEARWSHGEVAGYITKKESEAARKRKRERAEDDEEDDDISDASGKGKTPLRRNDRKRRKAVLVVDEDSDPDR